MSRQSPIITFDIGTHSVHAGHFEISQGGGLRVINLLEQPLELASTDETTFASLIGVLKSICSQIGVKSARVAFSVSGQLVFTRIVRLPATAPSQISQMVKFEAQQNVPFQMNEVVWDYQLISGATSSDLECIIVAIKSDILDQINAAVVASGNLAEFVDVSPLASYNALRFNYPNVDGCILFVDMGAKATQLVFSENGRIFIRGVPIAGNQITQSIAQDLKEPFAASEIIKQGKGFVGLGGGYEDPPDEVAARVSKIIRTVMTRLHAEIVRSISFYRTQHGGSSPSKILLAGGTASLAYMDLFLKEKLSCEVEYFNPLRNVEAAPGADTAKFAETAHRFGTVVGLATRFLPQTPVEINLVPNSVRNKLEARKKSTLIATTSLILAAAFAVPIVANLLKSNVVAAEKNALQTELSERNSILRKMEVEEKRAATLKNIGSQILALSIDKQRWIELLEYLNENAVTGIWLTDIEPLSGEKPVTFLPNQALTETRTGRRVQTTESTEALISHIRLAGFYESYDRSSLMDSQEDVGLMGESRVDDFVKNILAANSPFALTKEEVDKQGLIKRDVDAADRNIALRFEITIPLKEPISLIP